MRPLVFVSHSGQDKRRYIRPLVEALIHGGFEVFIDNPLELGLSAAEIEQLRFIRFGSEWRGGLMEALRESDVILGCLSQNILGDSQILHSEIWLGLVQKKLVACVIDDTPPDAFSAVELGGLQDLSGIQSLSIDTGHLSAALDIVKRGEGDPQKDTSEYLAWQRFLVIAGHIHAKSDAEDQRHVPLDSRGSVSDLLARGFFRAVEELLHLAAEVEMSSYTLRQIEIDFDQDKGFDDRLDEFKLS